ncbi:hypothetical protein Sste5346_009686, partial [Sporothrix stenoceras]
MTDSELPHIAEYKQAVKHLDEIVENDAQLRAAAPDLRVTKILRDPSLNYRQVLTGFLTAYEERPALGVRAYNVVNGERKHLPKFNTISYGELRSQIKALSCAWRFDDKFAIHPGELVACIVFTGAEYVAVDIGCVYSQAISVPIQANLQSDVALGILADVEPACLVISIDYLDQVIDYAVNQTTVRSAVVINADLCVDADRQAIDNARNVLAQADRPIALATFSDLVDIGKKHIYTHLPALPGGQFIRRNTTRKPIRLDGMADETEKDVVAAQQEQVESAEVERALVDEEDVKVTLKTKLAVFALTFMYESYLFTLIMPAAVLSYINADLGPNPNYSWIAISWNLGAAVIVTIGGRLSDISGRRWFLLFGAGAAAVGAIIGATGQSINQMIASGIIFGVGGGFQEMCFACALELVPNKYRFRTIGMMIMANHFSSFGPLIGYAFVAYVKIGWRACYWWCFAWEATAFVLLFFFYHPPNFEHKHEYDHKTKLQLLKELDYYPWKSAGVIAPLIIGFSSLVALGFWEAYMPLKYPILPPRLFVQWR